MRYYLGIKIFEVYGVEDLKLMYTLLGSEFVLMNDIDLSDDSWNSYTDTDVNNGWELK